MIGTRLHTRGLVCGAILAALWLFPLGPVAQAGTIVAVGSGEQMSDGPYAGWYKYTYAVTWTGGKRVVSDRVGTCGQDQSRAAGASVRMRMAMPAARGAYRPT